VAEQPLVLRIRAREQRAHGRVDVRGHVRELLDVVARRHAQDAIGRLPPERHVVRDLGAPRDDEDVEVAL
jgi:hypothetical protein